MTTEGSFRVAACPIIIHPGARYVKNLSFMSNFVQMSSPQDRLQMRAAMMGRLEILLQRSGPLQKYRSSALLKEAAQQPPGMTPMLKGQPTNQHEDRERIIVCPCSYVHYIMLQFAPVVNAFDVMFGAAAGPEPNRPLRLSRDFAVRVLWGGIVKTFTRAGAMRPGCPTWG